MLCFDLCFDLVTWLFGYWFCHVIVLTWAGHRQGCILIWVWMMSPDCLEIRFGREMLCIVLCLFVTWLFGYKLGMGKVVFLCGLEFCHFIVWILVWHEQCCVLICVLLLSHDCLGMSLASARLYFELGLNVVTWLFGYEFDTGNVAFRFLFGCCHFIVFIWVWHRQ